MIDPAMIEENPRKGADLFNDSGAPTTPVSFVELLICDLLTIGVTLVGVWVAMERVREVVS